MEESGRIHSLHLCCCESNDLDLLSTCNGVKLFTELRTRNLTTDCADYELKYILSNAIQITNPGMDFEDVEFHANLYVIRIKKQAVKEHFFQLVSSSSESGPEPMDESHVEQAAVEERSSDNQSPEHRAQASAKFEINSNGSGNKQSTLNSCAAEFICVICEREFKSERGLKNHTTLMHSIPGGVRDPVTKKWKCIACLKSYSSSMDLKKHLNSCRGDPALDPNFDSETGKYNCLICGNVFNGPLDFSRHLTHAHTVLVGNTSSTDFSQYFDLKSKSYRCPKCDVIYASSTHFRQHLRVCSGVKLPRGTGKRRKCPKCGLPFSSGYLSAHLKKCDGLILYDIDVYKKTGSFQCIKCNKQFGEDRGLRRHVRLSHTALVGEFKCKVCDLNFKTKLGLGSHIRQAGHGMIPEGKKTEILIRMKRALKCTKCSKSFRTRKICKYHVKYVCGKKPAIVYKCEVCQKTFNLRVSLLCHELTHSNKVVQSIRYPRMIDRASGVEFKCKYTPCKKVFPSRLGLYAHNNLVHSQTIISMRLRGLAHFVKKNYGNHPVLGSLEEGKSDVAVLEMLELLRNHFYRPNRPHFVYIILVLPLGAAQLGPFAYLRGHQHDETAKVEYYVGISNSDRENSYHSNPSTCIKSTVNSAIHPSKGKVAYLVRTVRFDGEVHKTNVRMAKALEAQIQLMMAGWAVTKPVSNTIQFSALNKKIEISNAVNLLSEEEIKLGVSLGRQRIPLMTVDDNIFEASLFSEDSLVGNNHVMDIFKSNHAYKKLEYCTPAIQESKKSNSHGSNAESLNPLEKYLKINRKAFDALEVPTDDDKPTKDIAKILKEFKSNQPNNPHYVYLVVVLPEEAKTVGFRKYMITNQGNSAMKAGLYVGVNSKPHPSTYHFNRITPSSIRNALKPEMSQCGFHVKTFECSGKTSEENHRDALALEAQLILLMSGWAVTQDRGDGINWHSVNQQLEVSNARDYLSDEEVVTGLAAGRIGLSPFKYSKTSGNESQINVPLRAGFQFPTVLSRESDVVLLDIK